VKLVRIATIAAAIIVAGAIVVAAGRHDESAVGKPIPLTAPKPVTLPTTPGTYLGVYAPAVPRSYTGVTAFTNATGVTPRLVACYSGWQEPFPASFATKAAQGGAVPLVQINPKGVRLAAIAAGLYDHYLSTYAEAVRAYGHPVILSFGHEMNGDWYNWGYRHTSPATFVAAWRHIVTIFRAASADNVTWLWTVNIINDTQQGKIPSPARWWPGSKYVTWVGIDGYYLKPSWRFVSLFGPTIAVVRELTGDPILIAETAAAPTARQPAKIADLFAGVKQYQLLGFVWFDAAGTSGNWRLSPAGTAAFSRGASKYPSPRAGS
jgi:mannan endo-1,4-beta-mannosidase